MYGKENFYATEKIVNTIVENEDYVMELFNIQRQYNRGFIWYKEVEETIDNEFDWIIQSMIQFLHGKFFDLAKKKFSHYDDYEESNVDTNEVYKNVVYRLTSYALHNRYKNEDGIYWLEADPGCPSFSDCPPVSEDEPEPGPTEVREEDEHYNLDDELIIEEYDLSDLD